MNLYEELIDKLEHQNKTIEDIEFVCGRDFYVDVNEFLEIAKKTNYDNGFGATEIAKDLLIVGKDWWLERQDYDGSEWFEYKTMPIKPNVKLKILRVGCGMWSTLKEINEVK